MDEHARHDGGGGPAPAGDPASGAGGAPRADARVEGGATSASHSALALPAVDLDEFPSEGPAAAADIGAIAGRDSIFTFAPHDAPPEPVPATAPAHDPDPRQGPEARRDPRPEPTPPAASPARVRVSTEALVVTCASALFVASILLATLPGPPEGPDTALAIESPQAAGRDVPLRGPDPIPEAPAAPPPPVDVAAARPDPPRLAAPAPPTAAVPVRTPARAAPAAEPPTPPSHEALALVGSSDPPADASSVESEAPEPTPSAGVSPLSESPPVVVASAETPPPAPAAAQAGSGDGDAGALAGRSRSASVQRVLDRYREAFNALDPAAAQAVWPSLDSAALSRAFGEIREQTFEYDGCRIAVIGARAVASCGGTLRYVPRVGGQRRVERREWEFTLVEAGGRWAIETVVVR